ncbi:MAG TPA: POTRA domain-containing protein [Candidatus Angelobacter sp.]|nr:POTRA domain-containing protein [Candidatus Angelobacter sp.]
MRKIFLVKSALRRGGGTCASIFRLHLLALIFLLISLKISAQQVAQPSISYEGQNVSSIEIAGRPDVKMDALESLILQKTNTPYSQEKIDATIAGLKGTGQFKDVQLEIYPETNGVQVLLVAEPALYFGVFEFGEATKAFSYPRLLQIANFSNQEAYTASRVAAAQKALLLFLRRDGYFLATVEPELETDSAHGVVNVLFRTALNHRAKLGKIALTDIPQEEQERLEKRLRAWRARFKGAYLKEGKGYSLKKLESAASYLQGVLSGRDYLAARVSLVSANYVPETNRADITFKVTPGPKIAVKTQGARISGRTLKRLVPVYQENSVDPDLVQEGARNLVSYFQSQGYFNASVEGRIEKEPSLTTVLYQIEKRKRGKVASIEIRGNEHIDGEQLRPYVAVSKARPWFFSHGKYSEQLVHKGAKNLETVYRNAGYSQVKITSSIQQSGDKLNIAFDIQEGAQDVVDSLSIQGNDALAEKELAPRGLNLGPGKPYSQQLLQKDRSQIMAVYLKRGFLTARFKAISSPVENDPHRVTVLYMIDEGPQVRTTQVGLLGAQRTRPEIIAKQSRIPVQQPLSEAELLESESQLYRLGVFDWASVRPQRTITNESEAEVLVKVHESPRNNLTYGVGFEFLKRGGVVPGGTIALPNLPPIGLPGTFSTSEATFFGPRGSIQYSRLNFRGRAQTLAIGGFAGRLDQRASASWINPSVWNGRWTTNLTISGERSTENPIFTATQGEAGIQFQRFLDGRKTQSIFLRYTLRRTNLTNLLIPDLVLPEDRNIRLSTFSASYIRDTRDKPLDAHRGLYESFDVAINPSVLGSNTNFGRFLGQTAYYHSVMGTGVVWANSLRLGMEQAFADSLVPLSERFFTGGGSTLRGFPLDGAGPQRNVPVCSNPADTATCSQIRVPVGGLQLFILNSELRFPIPIISKLSGVGFYDGGNVYTSIGLQNFFSEYSNNVGLGLRYATPVGPIRIDVGHNLNPVRGIGSTQIFITLGQAF